MIHFTLKLLNISLKRCFWEYDLLSISFVYTLFSSSLLGSMNNKKKKLPITNYRTECWITA